MQYEYGVSLTHPDRPQQDPMSQVDWNAPLVSLDQAIRAVAGPEDIVYGDPTAMHYDPDRLIGLGLDQGWDLDYGPNVTTDRDAWVPRRM